VGAGDTNEEPWRQAEGNRAKLSQLKVRANYWIVHRLTLPSVNTNAYTPRVEVNAPDGVLQRDVIFNRILIEGSGWNNAIYYGFSENCGSTGSYDTITVQNSVLRSYYGGSPPQEAIALDLQCGSNLRAVNNEIYDWAAHNVQIGQNGAPELSGVIVENNDLYASPVIYTQGGEKMRGEDPLSVKAYGTSASPLKIVHNRIWGSRQTDLSTCCNGTQGNGIIVNLPFGGPSFQYIAIHNNVIFDSQNGIDWYPSGSRNQSVIGNIFYKIDRYKPDQSSTAVVARTSATEFYLNSFIANGEFGLSFGNDQDDLDIRCNVFLSGGAREGAVPQSSTQADFNAFYDTPYWSFNGTGTDKNLGVSSRADAVNYSTGSVVRWADASECRTGAEAACFLYMATNSGKSLGSALAPCTQLGCTFVDGSVTWQAIRGPYTFYRKLRTGPEAYTVPYARSHTSAPESRACPADYAARQGIGIN
jgi:hypothetical protein